MHTEHYNGKALPNCSQEANHIFNADYGTVDFCQLLLHSALKCSLSQYLTDCGDCGDDLAELEFVEDGRLTGGIEPHLKTNTRFVKISY